MKNSRLIFSLFAICFGFPISIAAADAPVAVTPQAVVADYAKMVEASYTDGLAGAKKLQAAVDAFLASPDDVHLTAAKEAWKEARKPYLQTEAYRFYEGPIDFENKKTKESGPEGRINAWPLNEAYVDYVDGNAKSGIINDTSVKLSKEFLESSNQQKDEKDVTTGYHAIEFLLWGQDVKSTGHGTRPAADYIGKDNPINERRRHYLKLVSDLLVEDLQSLVTAWEPGKKNYAAQFEKLPPAEALGKILTGLASLSGSEMSGERMGNALVSGEHKDAQSCFSGTTNQDFVYDARGLHNVYLGDYNGRKGASLSALVAAKDAKLDASIRDRIAAIEKQMAALPDFEGALKTPKDSAERKSVQAVVDDLNALAKLFVEAGKALGAKVEIVPAS